MQEFVGDLALAPPEVEVNHELLQAAQKEMDDAANAPLPDEDDADL